VITEDNAVVENLTITASGKEAAIFVLNSANVVLRNIKIVHEGSERVQGQNNTLGTWMDESGAGIYFKNSPNIIIENVHVSLVRPSPNPSASNSEVCANEYCGPFPYEMKYAYNIWGQDSDSPTLSNVYVTGFDRILV
jgi:phage-related protein